MRKILLIAAPFVHRGKLLPYVPYGLLSLQAAAKEHGGEVDVLALSTLAESLFDSSDMLALRVADLVDGESYQAVGLSTMCSSFHHSLGIAIDLRERFPELQIWMGGPHASVWPSLLLERFPEIDAVFVGEGEGSFPDMLVRWARQPDTPISNLRGVCTREAPFLPRRPISDLDELPFVDQADDLLPSVVSSQDPTSAAVPLEVERGCSGRCTFCSTHLFWGDRIRYKSDRRVIAEMDRLHTATGRSLFSLIGDNMAASPQRLLAFSEAMRREAPNYLWGCSLTVDGLQLEHLNLLWAGGCRRMFVGIESASQDTLDRIRKGIDLQHSVELVYAAIDMGFSIHTSFIVGFPWETGEDLRKTYKLHLDLLKRGVAHSYVDSLCPLPGTDLQHSDDVIQPGKGNSVTAFDDLPLGAGAVSIMKRCPELFSQFGRLETKNVDRVEVDAVLRAARMVSNYYEQPGRDLFWPEQVSVGQGG